MNLRATIFASLILVGILFVIWYLFEYTMAGKNEADQISANCNPGTCLCEDSSCSRDCCLPLPPPPPESEAFPPASADVDIVDTLLRRLHWGNIAFDTPTTMEYDQSHILELLLSPTLSVVQLQAQLERDADAETASVRISNRMEADLTGRGFAIEALTPSLQAVASTQVTRWRWQVTPTSHGSQQLHLALSAVIQIEGRDTPLVVRTFDRTIEVDIGLPQRVSGFVEKHWQWLWAAIVVPVAGYLWRRRKKRSDANSADDPPRAVG